MRTLTGSPPSRGMLYGALLGAALMVAACGSRATETTSGQDGLPTNATARIDEHHYLGAPFTVENLTVWPVHTDAPLDVGEFLTLQEAQAQGVADVREIGGAAAQQLSRSGIQIDVQTEAVQTEEGQQQATSFGGGAQVNRLVIENKGDLPLLVCAGTIVKGGNQDRQIGQDIVIAAGETVPVDAFCVEQGRWTNVREGVANAGGFVALETVASKGIRTKGQFLDDQSGVWQEVAAQRERALAGAPIAYVNGGAGGGRPARIVALSVSTTLVDSIDHADDGRKQAREGCVAALREHFDGLMEDANSPVGFAYAINGKAEGVRVFAHDRLFRQHFESFAASLALEAETAGETEFEPPTADVVVALVHAIEKDATESRERASLSNTNVLYTNGIGFNGNCLFEDEDGKQIPVTRDWTSR